MAESDELISFVASMAGEGSLRVEENLGEGFVRLRVAEAERRQAKHDIRHVEDIVIEMLRNARDAGASRVYVATLREGDERTLLFIDDGCGVPADMRERIFDARVTSKLESVHMDRWGVHGRGMALYSIRQNARVAEVTASARGRGTAFRVVCDLGDLPERADQSSWPQAGRDEAGRRVCVRGPHNIIRTACEFALEELHGCDVYLGSPTEIAATLYAQASRNLDASRLLFVDDATELAVTDRLGAAADAADLMAIAASLGIRISERTAHRILAGTVPALKSVSSRLLRERGERAGEPPRVDLARDRRGLKIAADDLDRFRRGVERDFADLAERYYLALADDPKIRVTRDRITVSFDLSKGD